VLRAFSGGDERHSQISTTMNTYAHVLPRLQRDATAKIEALLNGDDKEKRE